MKHDIWTYLLVMSAVTLAIRILPLTLIRRQIRSRFLQVGAGELTDGAVEQCQLGHGVA